jgi:hypothetical protein
LCGSIERFTRGPNYLRDHWNSKANDKSDGRETHPSQQRQTPRKKTKSKDGHDHPGATLDPTGFRCFKKPNGALIEPMVIEESKPSTSDHGNALIGRTHYRKESRCEKPQSDHEFYGEILMQLKMSPF